MTEYTFHWLPGSHSASKPHVTLAAPSHLHGAALALRRFVELGCDIAVPLAHVDITEQDGAKQTLLVEEVLDWLHEPEQRLFVEREGLMTLVR
jgi:hypothetical protein